MCIPFEKIPEDIVETCLKHYGSAIRYIPVHNRTDKLVRLALENSKGENILQFVHCHNEDYIKMAAKYSPRYIDHAAFQTEEICDIAIRNDPFHGFKSVINQTDHLCKLALSFEPMIFRFIKNPTYEHKMLAVQKDGTLIRWMKSPSPELQYAAVQNDPRAYHHIKKPTDEVKIIAAMSGIDINGNK